MSFNKGAGFNKRVVLRNAPFNSLYVNPMGLVVPGEALSGGFLLDELSVKPKYAHSLRLLSSTYTGDCLRVRRSSDNAEQDIGFSSTAASNGQRYIDTAALLAFVGAGNGFVTTWYDQSGEGNDADQSTAGDQPQIVTSGAVIENRYGHPQIFFDDTNLSANAADMGGTASDFYVFSAVEAEPYVGASYDVLWSRSGITTYTSPGASQGAVGVGGGSSPVDLDSPSGVMVHGEPFLMSYGYDGSANQSWGDVYLPGNVQTWNGTLTPAGTIGTGATIYRFGTAATHQDGVNISEQLYFNSVQHDTALADQVHEDQQLAWFDGYKLLDAMLDMPAYAYSLRLLNTDYTGNSIRVRRSSDNAEQDIGFTADGELDTSALLTFVGAGNGFVTTWYDQSGNGYNATQTIASAQPRIVNAGVVETTSAGKPTLYCFPASLTVPTTGLQSGTNAKVSIYVFAQADDPNTHDLDILFNQGSVTGWGLTLLGVEAGSTNGNVVIAGGSAALDLSSPADVMDPGEEFLFEASVDGDASGTDTIYGDVWTRTAHAWNASKSPATSYSLVGSNAYIGQDSTRGPLGRDPRSALRISEVLYFGGVVQHATDDSATIVKNVRDFYF
jgi:hypothetical protein